MGLTQPGRWGLLLLLAATVTGCAGGEADGAAPTPFPVSTTPAEAAVAPDRPAADAASVFAEATPTGQAATPLSPVAAGALSLVSAFIDAPYRVVAVARSPLAPYTLIVASERSALCGGESAPYRCVADDTCGRRDTAPTCYFFIEPAADPATGETGEAGTRYITRWPDVPGEDALVTDSFRFIDRRTVEFRARNDAAVEEVWWLDMVTGAVALQSRR